MDGLLAQVPPAVAVLAGLPLFVNALKNFFGGRAQGTSPRFPEGRIGENFQGRGGRAVPTGQQPQLAGRVPRRPGEPPTPVPRRSARFRPGFDRGGQGLKPAVQAGSVGTAQARQQQSREEAGQAALTQAVLQDFISLRPDPQFALSALGPNPQDAALQAIQQVRTILGPTADSRVVVSTAVNFLNEQVEQALFDEITPPESSFGGGGGLDAIVDALQQLGFGPSEGESGLQDLGTIIPLITAFGQLTGSPDQAQFGFPALQG